ncbi:MAG TPA: hypothetical protein VJZ04_10765 [Lachnospiraceae bacterium]|nr:hypothetical protein [Lachnospiraceae bacterium]
MDLSGKIVKHSKFGMGTIINQNENNVEVKFKEPFGCKIFQYPLGFDKYLKLQDEGTALKIVKAIDTKKEEVEIEEQEKELKRQECELIRMKETIKPRKITKKRYLHKNNLAIKCNYCNGGLEENGIGFTKACTDEMITYNIGVRKYTWCTGENSKCLAYKKGEISREELDAVNEGEDFLCYESQMLNKWKASLGVYQSGVKRGKAMVFSDLSTNTLAILTTRTKGMKEEDRIIFAVFLAQAKNEESMELEGHILANEKYKISLTLEEAKQVRFWDYYYNETKPDTIKLGSGLFNYVADIQSAQILKQIVEVKTDEREKEYANEFYTYFCKIKNLSMNLIPSPTGGRTRIIKE